jgi:hypothetical protein
MVALNSIKYYLAITYTAMELFAACEDVNHGFIVVVNVGEGCVSRRCEEGVLNS